MFILTRSELLNPKAITMSSMPKRVLGRGLGIGVRGTVTRRVFWRLVLEVQFLRNLFALTPFPVAMFIWPHLALPISQAPLLMFILIWLFESRVLSYRDAARRGLIGEVEAARGLDVLAVRSREILTRIAARRDLAGSILHLVVEQSDMARVTPLTVVSVQVEGARYQLLDLADEERALIEARLFGGELDERLLARINQAEKVFLRSAGLDPRSVSAHARLAAMA